jgi:carbonic anhydrase
MRLLEAILETNERAVARGGKGDLDIPGLAGSLPLVSLTCIDPRLNRLIPEMLGVPEDQFIWLRNAGNIITGPLSSTMRSLALACAVKGGKEIALIGHTDCQVCHTTVMKLTDGFRALGVDRSKLPENLNEYFGLFASERQNVIRGAEFIRHSPLIGSNVPVHGLVMEIQTGRIEWVVNGYQTLSAPTPSLFEATRQTVAETIGQTAADALSVAAATLPEFNLGEMKFPEFKIGETTVDPNKWLSQIQSVPLAKPDAQPSGSGPMRVTAPERQLDRARKYRVIGSDQKVYGPIDGGKILDWIADGRVDWQTPSQVEGTNEWKPLSAWADSPKPPTIPLPPPVKPAPQLHKLKHR